MYVEIDFKRFLPALTVILSIFLTVQLTFALPLSLTEVQSIERDSLGIPFNCKIVSNNQFEFILEENESSSKDYNREEACRLANLYRDHIDNTLAPFWPLKNDLGLLVKNSELYNAYFHGNLYNENMPPHLGLIYVEGVEVESQFAVWSHEYGHAVFDEYVREKLNISVNFDDNVRKGIQKDESFISRKDVQALYNKIDELEKILDPLSQELLEIFNELLVETKKAIQRRADSFAQFQKDPKGKDKDAIAKINQKARQGLKRIELLRDRQEKLDKVIEPLTYQRGVLRTEIQLIRLKHNKENNRKRPVDLSLYRYLHEFFADLFAVVIHSDYRVIADALGVVQGRENYVEERNFGEDNIVFSTLLFKFDDVHGPHHFFTPTRNAIKREKLMAIIVNNKGHDFLVKVLELSQELLEEVSFGSSMHEFFYDFSPITKKFEKVNDFKFDHVHSFLREARYDFKLRLNGLSMTSFYNWCKENKEECVKVMREEIPKGNGGLFRTPLDFKEINERYTESINQLIESYFS